MYLHGLREGHGDSMYKLFVNLGGTKRCFPLPSLIDAAHIRIAKPTNYPPFELPIAVLQLVDAEPDSEVSSPHKPKPGFSGPPQLVMKERPQLRPH
jgi:hypothetical protein